jgi:hypothetical protein
VQYAGRGTIRHILDIAGGGAVAGGGAADEVLDFDDLLREAEAETFHCIWCLDVVRPSRRNGPRGYTVAEPWYFMHSTNNACIGHQHRIGGGVYLNPQYQGCYVAMGCEQALGRSRRECQCIAGGRTYCQHASSPPRPGGPCV